MPRKLAMLTVAAVLALTGAACSDDDGNDQDAGDTAESVVDEAQEGAEDAASTASSVADGAASTASSVAEESETDAAEAAARTIAADQGEDEFDDNDVDVEGDLTCEATAQGDDAGAIDITCSGTTEDGREIGLTGTTSELPGASATELVGDFTGTVAGEEVFTTDRLGDDD